MTRVIALVQGQTELAFVSQVLGPSLWRNNIALTATLLGKRAHRGGNPKYQRLERDVLASLKHDRSCYCTTMLDFYGLGNDFPGMPSSDRTGLAKVRHIEQEVKKRIEKRIPIARPDVRFIPYIQLHEFEALLFSNPGAFTAGIKQPHLASDFEAIRREFQTPEDINLEEAPSKRVIERYSGYQKVVDGVLAATAVGVDRMRSECPHFCEWIETLEGLRPLTDRTVPDPAR